MKDTIRCALIALLLVPLQARAGDGPDGTQFTHHVIAVDGPDLVRIRYCGVPVQVRLANLQLRAGAAEGECLKYLKDALRSGTLVKIELEPELAGDTAPPPAQVFAGATHVNLEMVKRGLAVSDARSKKFGSVLQTAQLDAMNKKAGVWGTVEKIEPVAAAGEGTAGVPPALRSTAVPPVPAAAAKPAPPGAASQLAPGAAPPASEIAPLGYLGMVVADLSSREYHYPGSRYASSIRAGARIEYKSPEEAERAGKVPSPFSFPDRAKALAEKAGAHGGAAGGGKASDNAKKALAEALNYMQEARRVSQANNALANENWQKAARLLTENLDRLIPVADADPNNRELQKLTEDLATNLYSCKKNQSL